MCKYITDYENIAQQNQTQPNHVYINGNTA